MSKKILVLISGSGSNLQSLIDAEKSNKLSNGHISCVISSSKNAYGLKRAQDNGIRTIVHSLYPYYKGIPKEDLTERQLKRNQYELDLAEIVKKENPDLIICAGWLLILGKKFLNEFDLNKLPIINLHPALPSQFDGTTHAIEMAYNKCQELNEKITTGCMVHYVIEDVDKGAPIIVKKIDIEPGKDTLEQFEEKLHSLEHIAIVEAAVKILDNLDNLD